MNSPSLFLFLRIEWGALPSLSSLVLNNNVILYGISKDDVDVFWQPMSVVHLDHVQVINVETDLRFQEYSHGSNVNENSVRLHALSSSRDSNLDVLFSSNQSSNSLAAH